MRVKKISVSRLFGLFNHVIPMKMPDHVTIITSPNGYGKTTILRLVNGFLSGRYAEVRRIPFRDFELTFENNLSLQVIRVDSPRAAQRESTGADLTVTLVRGTKKEEQATLSAPPRDAFSGPLSVIDRHFPHLHRVSPSLWRDRKTGREMDYEDVFRAYGQFFLPTAKIATYAEPPWLAKFRENISVKFIEVQRLLRAHKPTDGGEEEPWRPAVVVYSAELAELIKEKLAEYASLSQSLDRSFPKRLVEKTQSEQKAGSIPLLRQRLQELENKRKSLADFGLLEGEDEGFDLPGWFGNDTLTDSVLPVYAEDAENKLRVFDDIAAKIDLLTSIVNTHFQFKVLTINRQKGFQFFTTYPGDDHPRPLATQRLSSGEQHMLVLLYELLFAVTPGSLVMIDEPEISLHVTWQLEFLRDIQRIAETRGIDALIATHAPGIISDRLDLTVDLQAP